MFGYLPILAGLLLAAPPVASDKGAAADEGWRTYLTIKQLDPDLARRPEAATMSTSFHGWASWPLRVPELPKELRKRVFVSDSFVLLDVDGLGKATGCRPLRPSAQPALDALSCDLLMEPGYFSAYLLPPNPPKPPEQWVIGLSWRRVDPATARKHDAAPRPLISPVPSPAPPKPKS